MTKAQLDAIRDRVETAHRNPGCCSTRVANDLRALLGEVERLTAERNEMIKEKTSAVILRDDERLMPVEAFMYAQHWCNGADRPCAVTSEPHGHWRTSRKVPVWAVINSEREAAFKRGVVAMREAAVAVAGKRANLPKQSDLDSAWCRSAECILDELRHLPVPADKS
jgi:hypothetical protein